MKNDLKDFKEFLSDGSRNDEVFSSYYNTLKVHKEKYKDRFIVIYSKYNKNGLDQENFSVSGYYDLVDNKIYDISYGLKEVITPTTEISFDSFSSLGDKIFNDLNQYIGEYMIKNPDEFKKEALDKYNHEEDWRIRNYQSKVISIFISKVDPTINLEVLDSKYELYGEDFYVNKTIYEEYLKNPKDAIKKYAKVVMEKYKCALGLNLFHFEAKQDYLKQIQENKNNEFDYLYLNKKLLDSIRNIDAKNFTITINYDNKELVFKYPYEELRKNLVEGSTTMSGYGATYEKVRSFFSDNDIKDAYGNIERNFSISNITSITYGKNVIYSKENPSKEKELDDYELEI